MNSKYAINDSHNNHAEPTVKAVIFDFGGVIADEGFRAGLKAIAIRNDLDQDEFYNIALEAVWRTGYVVGKGTEREFWESLRKLGIPGTDEQLRLELLDRFCLRTEMIKIVRLLRQRGLITAVLSDQTDWLDRLEQRDRFSKEFDRVFNSYHMGKGKRDPSVFDDALRALGISAKEAIFVDDSADHIERARLRGLRVIHYRNYESFLRELKKILRISDL